MAAIAQSTQDHSKRRVAYYYDSNIGNYYYGPRHVMKPQRIRMTHNLLLNYGLYKDLAVYRPYPATFDDMTRFHSKEYISFLQTGVADESRDTNGAKFNIGNSEDCPFFEGLYEFCQTSSGGSIAAAVKLNKENADIAINWMGGLHHAKKGGASGFCYTNDIVLGILELLKYHQRVLYVDIDVHHGDGVEEAFYTTDRVMTVSFHKYGNFFPNTGNLKEIGAGNGRLYSLNVPLRDGIRDDSYQSIFKPVMARVMDKFRPEAIVLQCGADSLNEDKIGVFNLTLRGHGECVSFLRSYNIPLMMLGGGGYTPKNVARCWTYETALALNKEISNDLPFNDYFEYFGPDFHLHINPSREHNHNTREYLRKVEEAVSRNLAEMTAAPSVQMQPIPDDAMPYLNYLSLRQDAANPDSRLDSSIMDGVTQDQGEFYDGETEGDDRRNEHDAKRAVEKERKVKKAKIEEKKRSEVKGREEKKDKAGEELEQARVEKRKRNKEEKEKEERRERDRENMRKRAERELAEREKRRVREAAQKEESVEVEPSEIEWDGAASERKEIKVTNISNERIAVKIKCTDLTLYKFRPIFTLIEVEETVKIRVTRLMNKVKQGAGDTASIVVAKCKGSDEDSVAIFSATPVEEREEYKVNFKVNARREREGTIELMESD